MPIKPLLKLKRLIKGKSLTASELGYKRINGRLTKPGTAAFNEKVEFTKEEKKTIIDAYKKRQSENPTEINTQKIIDRRNQFNKKLDLMSAEREYDLKKSEASRLSALKQRQLKEWARKLDSLLAVSKKGTVHEIKEKLFKELFKREITSIKVSAVDSNLQARQYNYLHELFTSDFYNLLHSSFVPTNLQNMNARDAVVFIETISKKAKNRKEKIYKEFRKDYVI